MAALTADRHGIVDADPRPINRAYNLTADSVVYAHSLVALLDDGTLKNLPDALTDEDTIVAVFYADEHLAEGVYNAAHNQQASDPANWTVKENITAWLDGTGGFTQADRGKAVFAVDDHTVSLDSDEDALPVAGVVRDVVGTDYVAVTITGTARSVAAVLPAVGP